MDRPIHGPTDGLMDWTRSYIPQFRLDRAGNNNVHNIYMHMTQRSGQHFYGYNETLYKWTGIGSTEKKHKTQTPKNTPTFLILLEFLAFPKT